MQGRPPFKNWLSDPRNQQIAELLWLIKNTEAKLKPLLLSNKQKVPSQTLTNHLNHCISFYQHLSHYYPPIVKTQLTTTLALDSDQQAILNQWQQYCSRLMQSSNSDEKAHCIAIILDSLNKMKSLLHQASSLQLSFQSEPGLSLEQISEWFLSLIDLFRHQQDNPAWANDFFQQLSTDAYQKLYQMLTHADIAHLMFHIYYYKLFPDQISQHAKHPDLLVSIDQRLSFLYQCIEQFVETFIIFSKNIYQLSPKNFLCRGSHLPQGITLRSKETYRQLIIDGLKKLNSKTIITAQTPTAEIIDAIFRAYQFWFNPNRMLDAIFMLGKRLHLDIKQPLDKTLYHHMASAFEALEMDACIHLYGYFSNNDTLYLLRILQFISHGGNLTQFPSLNKVQRQLINFLYQALIQIFEALSETLNNRHLPCNAIKVALTTKPPTPSKRNLEAIRHVIATYGGSTETSDGEDIESLFAELGHVLS